MGRLRPTAGKVAEALFAVLRDRLEGARVLDLFAGSGALGRGALERGAAEAVFVEADGRAAQDLRQRLAPWKERARVLRGRLPDALKRLEGSFDLVLADPPYGSPAGPRTLERLAPLVGEKGLVVFEHHHKEEYPERSGPLERTRSERYGETVLTFYRAGGTPGVPREGDRPGDEPRRPGAAPGRRGVPVR